MFKLECTMEEYIYLRPLAELEDSGIWIETFPMKDIFIFHCSMETKLILIELLNEFTPGGH